MAPQRTLITQIAKRWTPYRTATTRHKSLTLRTTHAAIAISDSTYERAKQEFPKHFKEELRFELHSDALCQKETTFHDLPFEILIEIAHYTSAPEYRQIKESGKSEVGFDIDISFSRINRKCRQAFFEYMSKEVVFVSLRFYMGPDIVDDRNLPGSLNEVFGCHNTQKLFAGIVGRKKATQMSIIQMGVEDYKGCGGRSISDVIFPCNDTNIVLLCGFIEGRICPTTNLSINVTGVGKRSISLCMNVLSSLCSILRGVKSAGLQAEEIFEPFMDCMNECLEQVEKPVLESKESTAIIARRKVQMLCDEKVDRRPNRNLPITTIIAINHFGFLEQTAPPVQVQHATMILIESVQRDLSNVLFSLPNDVNARSHFLLSDDKTTGGGFDFVKRCLCCGWNLGAIAIDTNSEEIEDWVYWGDVLRLLMSVVALELALVRALMSGHRDLVHMQPSPSDELRPPNGRYWRTQVHRIRSWSVLHLRSAEETLDMLDIFNETLRGQVLFGDAKKHMQFVFWRGWCDRLVTNIYTGLGTGNDLHDPIPQAVLWEKPQLKWNSTVFRKSIVSFGRIA